MPNAPHLPSGNRILDGLPAADFSRISPHLERVSLPLRYALSKPGKPLSDIYFLSEGIASVVAPLDDGALVEVGITGNEGFVGIPAALGADVAPQDAYIQVAGSGLRLTVRAMDEGIERSAAFKDAIFRYVQFFLYQVSQTAACNARHPLEVRLARWLLMARDRLGTEVLPLTHEFLAIMLGVQRPGVSIAANALRRAGLISYNHGRMTILDRHGLEAASCECYRIVRDELDRLFR